MYIQSQTCRLYIVCRRLGLPSIYYVLRIHIQYNLYWNVPCWGHQLWDINCCMCVCVCVCVCVSVCPPTYRYIAPRMIQRIILKFCGYVGCDDATNVSNFGYEPIKFSSFMLNIRMHTMQILVLCLGWNVRLIVSLPRRYDVMTLRKPIVTWYVKTFRNVNYVCWIRLEFTYFTGLIG